MKKLTVTLDVPDEINSLIEELFRQKVDEDRYKEKLDEIEKLAKQMGKPAEDPLKVLTEMRR